MCSDAFEKLPEGGDAHFITPFWKACMEESPELLLHLINPRDAGVPVEYNVLEQ